MIIPRPDPIVPPGGNWIHARFSPELKDGALEWIQKNSRYIVAEEVGGATSKTHYHAAIDSSVGIEAIKKRFQTQCKALGLVSKKGQENAYYGGVKECTDVSYICKEGKYVASKGFTDEELEDFRSVGERRYPPAMTSVPMVSHMTSDVVFTSTAKQMASKTTVRAKFVQHLKSNFWKQGEITEHNYHEKTCDLISELTEFSENAFTTPNGAVCVEHALWVFSSSEYREMIKIKNQAAIFRILR